MDELEATFTNSHLQLRPADGALALSADTVKWVAEIERVPGVRVSPAVVEVPCSAWSLDVVHRLAECAGCAVPSLPPAPPALVWQPERKSLSHQVDAARRILAGGALLLADEMGLGKTQSALHAAEEARQRDPGRPVLIMAPMFGRTTWQHEIATVVGDVNVCVLAGRTMSAKVWDPEADYYFCHYDIISAWWSQIVMRRPLCAIADEVHWLKNPKAKRSQGARVALGTAPFKILLTGTPMSNRPAELWPLLDAMAPRQWGSFFDYRKRYCGAQNNGYGLEDSIPTHVEELKQRLAPVYLRRLVGDIGHKLPALTRSVQTLEQTKQVRSANKEEMRGVDLHTLAEAIISGRISEDVLRTIGVLRRATSEAKFKRTVEYVSNLAEQGEHVVVFCWQREMVEEISRALGGHCVHGGFPAQARDEQIETFQSTLGHPTLTATYGTLREGVTLHAARHVVLHDLDWVPATILQAEKRIHRIGQKRACTSTWMVMEQSIDTVFARALLTKVKHLDTIFDEQPLADVTDLLPESSAEDLLKAAVAEWEAW